jgi:hypothetical protein
LRLEGKGGRRQTDIPGMGMGAIAFGLFILATTLYVMRRRVRQGRRKASF